MSEDPKEEKKDEETDKPDWKGFFKNFSNGIITGVFIVVFIYLLVNVTYLTLLSIPQLAGIHDAGNKIAVNKFFITFMV